SRRRDAGGSRLQRGRQGRRRGPGVRARAGRLRRGRGATVGRTAMTRPLYARLLRLKHITPGGLLCFVFLEGAVALGVLLALAELVTWWGVLLLPLTVALMVKLNDVFA